MLIWALPRSANADLIYAAATTCVSLLCLWVDVLGYALPLLYIALLCFALAMLSTSMLRLAFAALIKAAQRHCRAERDYAAAWHYADTLCLCYDCDTIPLLCSAWLRLAIAVRYRANLYLCCTNLYKALPLLI